MKQSRIFIYIFYFVIYRAFDKYSSFCFDCGFPVCRSCNVPRKSGHHADIMLPVDFFIFICYNIRKQNEKCDLLRQKQANTIKL